MWGSASEHRVVRVDADQANADLLPFEVVEGRLEALHGAGVGDVCVAEIEMDRVRRQQRRPGVEQSVDRGRGQRSGGPDQSERLVGVVDRVHDHALCGGIAAVGLLVSAAEPERPSSDGPETEASIGLRHGDH